MPQRWPRRSDNGAPRAVAADPGDHARLVDGIGQNAGDPAEDRIAGGMAEQVVDRLEPVQVEREQRERTLLIGLGDGGF